MRLIAVKELTENEDEFFKFYENTNPNIIPIIHNNEKKVYILTGSTGNNVVVFGNDYLLTFDKNSKLKSKKRLHNNIMFVEYGNLDENQEVESAMHSHLPQTGEFITATDICTLMLYYKYTGWDTYNVVSEKYLNMWNAETNTLLVMPMKTIRKIQEDQENRKQPFD